MATCDTSDLLPVGDHQICQTWSETTKSPHSCQARLGVHIHERAEKKGHFLGGQPLLSPALIPLILRPPSSENPPPGNHCPSKFKCPNWTSGRPSERQGVFNMPRLRRSGTFCLFFYGVFGPCFFFTQNFAPPLPPNNARTCCQGAILAYPKFQVSGTVGGEGGARSPSILGGHFPDFRIRLRAPKKVVSENVFEDKFLKSMKTVVF